jgi:hypothetical protein
MIPAENKNTIHFKQRLLLNCLLHDLEIATVNGGDSTSQYYTQLAVAKFTYREPEKNSIGLFYSHTTYIAETNWLMGFRRQKSLFSLESRVARKRAMWVKLNLLIV